MPHVLDCGCVLFQKMPTFPHFTPHSSPTLSYKGCKLLHSNAPLHPFVIDLKVHFRFFFFFGKRKEICAGWEAYLCTVCSLVHRRAWAAIGTTCCWERPPRSTPCRASRSCSSPPGSFQTGRASDTGRSSPARTSSSQLEREITRRNCLHIYTQPWAEFIRMWKPRTAPSRPIPFNQVLLISANLGSSVSQSQK